MYPDQQRSRGLLTLLTFILGQLQRQASMLAFVDVFWLLGVTCAAITPLMLFMKKSQPGKARIAVH